MNSRKLLSILVAIIMVFGTFTMSFAEESTPAAPAAAASTVTFTDVTDHWAVGAVEKWAGYGIVNGFEGLFRPNDTITRGEMAVILDNMMDYQEASKNTFTDLKAGQFYTDAILKANAAGIIKGDGTVVRPTDRITKEEAAVMMSRAFAVKSADNTKGFADAASVSDWAKKAVFGMEAKGYVSGFEGNFNPKANITRAEAVTMINNIVKAYYTTAGTYTDNVDGTAVIKVADVTLKGVTVAENLIIAEGVAKGDAYLDSVTVKGDTVVRGGGENSIHITGKSSITKITIEKIGDKLRVVIDDGVNVPEVQVAAANEEIIITGTVGTVDVQASDAIVYATAAEIKSATISGDNSKIIVGEKSTVDSVTVASTAKNTTIETAKGAVVKAVTASAEISVTGTGTVAKVTLKEGADGSSISTPSTSISVPSGVTGVTGAGDKPIKAGSEATNNTSGTDLNSTPAGGGGGGGGNGGGSNDPVLNITSVTASGSASNTIPADWNPATTPIVVVVSGENLAGVNLDVEVSGTTVGGDEYSHGFGVFTVVASPSSAPMTYTSSVDNTDQFIIEGLKNHAAPADVTAIMHSWSTLVSMPINTITIKVINADTQVVLDEINVAIERDDA